MTENVELTVKPIIITQDYWKKYSWLSADVFV